MCLKGVGRVAIGAAEIAGGEADENAGETGKGAFSLNAQIDFVYDEVAGHRVKMFARSARVQE